MPKLKFLSFKGLSEPVKEFWADYDKRRLERGKQPEKGSKPDKGDKDGSDDKGDKGDAKK